MSKLYQITEEDLALLESELPRILDTHMGSGSIAVACYKLGHALTACEIDQEYYDQAIERIKRETSQTRLFS